MIIYAMEWKRDLSDLRALAVMATVIDGSRPTQLSARSAVICLFGVMQQVAVVAGTDRMQHACADLVRSDIAWSSMLAKLPSADPAVVHIAAMARGVLVLSGVENMRAALAFWATENDPAEWQRVTGI